MKSQGSISLRRAISLDRLSASFGKKKRFSAGMASSPESINEEGQRSPGIRTAAYRTSHTEFLNWIVYSRDLSPDLTEDQRRTCPVCEDKFQDRGSMLRHIPTCFKLPAGFYTCLQCEKREKIGRYHVNGCNDIHIYQESWLKRILSFRSSNILVDASDANPSVPETTEPTWSRTELPSDNLVNVMAEPYIGEMAGTAASDWMSELDGSANPWDFHDAAAWQSNTAMWNLDSPGIQEMPADQQPQELASHCCESPAASSSAVYTCEDSQKIYELDSANIELSGVRLSNIDGYPSQGYAQEATANCLSSLATDCSVAESNVDVGGLDGVQIYKNAAAYCPNDKFMVSAGPERMDIDFPSSPISPISLYEHGSPISPMEFNRGSFPASRYSTFSSMSSLSMDDVLTSGFATSGISQGTSPASQFFKGKVPCFEPGSIDDEAVLSLHIPPVLYRTFSPPNHLAELEGEGDLHVLHQDIEHKAEACLQSLNAKSEALMSEYFDKLYGRNSRGPLPVSDPSSGYFKEQSADTFDIGLADGSDQSSAESTSSSPWSESQPASITSSVESSSPKDIMIDSPKSEDRHPLSRSPAFRAVYRCNYGSCTFEPSGKKAYHRRTLSRHQEKCIHSPLPREKKPCKCNFPGCNKGFSRSDGLNAHRKASGHGVKFELQVMEEEDSSQETAGFF